MNTLTRARQRAKRTADSLSALAFTLALPVVLAMALFAKEGTGTDVPTINPFITRAQEARKGLNEARDALLAKVEGEKRSDLTEDEDREFRRITEEIKTHDERVAELLDSEKRERSAATLAGSLADAAAAVSVRSEPNTYGPGSEHGYYRDLLRSTKMGDPDARERLLRHGGEVSIDAKRRVANGQAEYRDLTRVDGAGGQFVPPLYLVDQYVKLARAARATADLVNRQPLPPGTDSINIPKVSTGTATAIQTADNATVQKTDLADANLSAPVRTIAGHQDVAIQLIDQSPINFDEVIFMDLMGDYATKVDLQVLSGSAASGQVQGIFGTSGINAVTYTDATPTVPEVYAKLADAIQRIHTGRFLPPTHIVMHPRRWGWFLASLDSSNRPLVVPNVQGPWNAAGTQNGVDSQMVVGTLMGLPVVTDPSIPITNGAGTNEDQILIMRSFDLWLWESSIRSRVLDGVLSGTLEVRLQVYGYVAFQPARYPLGISVISGTGLITPTF